jgi:hypothetical protein
VTWIYFKLYLYNKANFSIVIISNLAIIVLKTLEFFCFITFIDRLDEKKIFLKLQQFKLTSFISFLITIIQASTTLFYAYLDYFIGKYLIILALSKLFSPKIGYYLTSTLILAILIIIISNVCVDLSGFLTASKFNSYGIVIYYL